MVVTYEQNRRTYPDAQERKGERYEDLLRGHGPPVPDEAGFVSVYNETFHVTRYLNDPDLTQQLKTLVEESAKPLAQGETCFAVDGTVFGQGGSTPRGVGSAVPPGVRRQPWPRPSAGPMER